ncbi:competence type IV pilus major pilin ComGC [Gracilibacillus sp. YIM 98692]|uniref:competence type IV pilus major pilin ComGC n=1 Tax=Gracilibacillus sp. YIM 98692 TaxID=2663532 RepID=UPI0013D456B3|nr:competence type IV pilus major pilin ComGC [Gracilibacillus sp. YIM 98692]
MLKNQKGFTLIEMLIVLAVISVLLILFIPNLSNQSDTIQETGCDALIQLADSQRIVYEIEQQQPLQSADELEDNNYLKTITCHNDTQILEYDPNEEIFDTTDNVDSVS